MSIEVGKAIELRYIEAKENLKYLISEDCADCQFDYIDEIRLAIDSIDKQIPKAPREYTLYTESDEEVKYNGCPRCKDFLDRSNYFLKICSCGQKLEVE